MMKLFDAIHQWARRVKQDSVMLWFACRHPQTPWMAKAIAAFAVAYALSPIDLSPDFIPVLGYLDDALLLPAMVWLAVRCLPEDVKDECHAKRRHGYKPMTPNLSVVGALFGCYRCGRFVATCCGTG